jgi:hypothetical protein
MRTPPLPVVDWTDAPADLNGLVRFGEKRNLVSARVPSRFKRTLLNTLPVGDLVTEFLLHQITHRQRIGYNIPQAVVYSLMLMKMGTIVARNMSS